MALPPPERGSLDVAGEFLALVRARFGRLYHVLAISSSLIPPAASFVRMN